MLTSVPSEPSCSPVWTSSQRCDACGPGGAPALLTDSRYALYLCAVVARAGTDCCGCRCLPEPLPTSSTCSCCAECAVAYGCGGGIASQWQGYFRNIPTRHDTTVEWTPDELAWIAGTNLYTGTIERLNHLKEWYDRVVPRLNLSAIGLSTGVFTWCVSNARLVLYMCVICAVSAVNCVCVYQRSCCVPSFIVVVSRCHDLIV